MDTKTINNVLLSLAQSAWGWRADLPGVRFLGQPVGLRVDTERTPAGGPPPALDATEVALVRLVLGNLYELIPLIESEYRGHADSPDIIDRAREPHVWLSREWMAEEGLGHWSFVVGIEDAPDWAIHCEFDRLAFRRIWSGD